MKVIEWLSGRVILTPSDKDVGIEIEVEGRNLPTRLSTKFWKIERDGSLRGEAYEYVSSPLKMGDLHTYIKYLEARFQETDGIIDESIRAGVHVHMNVQHLSVDKFWSVVVAYFILEDLLVKWCGPSREGNHFCLRAKDAEWVLMQAYRAAKENNIHHLCSENIRYCSLNFLSLFKYGTLEFRAMRTTADLSQIETWTNMLWELRTNALEFANPLEMINSISGDGVDAFLDTVLPTYGHLLKVPDYSSLIYDGIRRVQLIANSRNWGEEIAVSKVSKSEDIDALLAAEIERLQQINRPRGRPIRLAQPAPRQFEGILQPVPNWVVEDE